MIDANGYRRTISWSFGVLCSANAFGVYTAHLPV
jgi:hypothetical protein